MSQPKYCQGPRCHTYKTKDAYAVLKDISNMKRASDLHYLITMSSVLYDAKMIGSRCTDDEPLIIMVEQLSLNV